MLLPSASLALNPERHYEMVSPLFKGGYGVQRIDGVAADGEALAFYDPGVFAGAPSSGLILNGVSYLARRTASGWSTAPMMAPVVLIAEPAGSAGDMTPSLNLVLEMGRPGPNTGHPLNEQDLLVHQTTVPDTSTGWEPSAILKELNETEGAFRPTYRASSLGFCHMLLGTNASETLVPEAVGGVYELYDVGRGCGGEPKSLALVGLNNQGKLINPACYTTAGDEAYALARNNTFNAVSADGGEVFFTVCPKTSGQEYGPEVPHQVFVRLGGSRTLEVSRPLEAGQPFGGCVGESAGKVPGEVPCEGAAARASSDFAGASQDGSRVYFTTSAPLTGEANDSKNDLYLATIGCPSGKPGCGAAEREATSLRQVSHAPSVGEAADVQGVVRLAPDGSRVYFVARGVLTSEPGPEGHTAVKGAENLYVYGTRSGTIAFIGDLCSGASLSGTVEDARCPSPTGVDTKLWEDNEAQAQTAGSDGRFFVFASFAQLLTTDSNMAKDVYRYDAQTGQLDRVSGGENGFDDNGNRTVINTTGETLGASIAPGYYGGRSKEQYEMDNRAISEDGSRIVFTTAEPLSPNATNGLENAYEWHESAGGAEGSVSLVSSGSSEDSIARNHVVISPSGSDIFFVTTQGLVGQDTDGLGDVYDARLGAGFPAVATPPQPCSGDACQGPLTNPAPLLVPGSVSQAPGGNFAPATTSTGPKAKPARCRKGYIKKRRRCVRSRSTRANRAHRGGRK
ncbi:MAG TPA: hypothetical protein VNY27_10170 [Solirubrobacteraceae bacterium]|nr:hypothetical protein [Solirubrobacteraceae bacterium]